MLTRGPYHGLRLLALLGGVVAVAALALSAVSPPARVGSTIKPREHRSTPSVSDGLSGVTEQALHRVCAVAVGATARHASPVGWLPVLTRPPAARCAGRPGDTFGAAPLTSGPPLRILFCTWLN
jgi:hypothetical protein